MRRIRYISLFLFLTSCAFAQKVPEFQKGMSYPSWSKNALLQPASLRSIEAMKETGVKWVALCVFWFQDNLTSTVITEDFTYYSASKPSLVKAIDDIHNAGMKVMLKPMLDTRTGDWRGYITPSKAWFDAYNDYILDWAGFAVDNDVDMFCMGCEFVEATKFATWGDSWRTVIANIKQIYPGPLTYAANHGNEQSIGWWDTLDYIGIDAYYSLTNQNDPSPETLIAAWEKQADKIEAWRNRWWPDKPVVFTEIGYRSYDGANMAPWDYSQKNPLKLDLQEQADCYNAAIQVLSQREWFYGFYWWNWETDPNAGGMNHIGYTIQNKPAQNLLAEWYKEKLIGGRFDPSGIVGFESYY